MKTAILKLSGKAFNEFTTNSKWVKIINDLRNSYDGLILVHGAGTKISEWSQKMDCETEFVNGQRVTDEKTMEIVAAVQAGLLNAKLVSFLLSKNFNASGHTGNDRGLFVAEYLNKNLGFVGSPVLNGDTDWLIQMLQEGVIPVFSSICRDHQGNLMNVNADVFTKELAKAVQADTVLFLSDIDGVLIDGHTQKIITEEEINKGISDGFITGGMIPKLQSSLELIHNYTKKVWIGNKLDDMNFNTLYSSSKFGGTWIVDTEEIAIS